ncbi:lantibiotic dehydratase C-terminal domain-containing protein [Streptomyces sp. PsTaAH-124]|uniref:lantibiotic dehydratase C-terminal domain-containing protein n=1 Tax=Streptomyces sp. PsTaAH-124 TaxID=1157638 RepID=UPI00131A3ADA|nr:lantibiotic dehydratase C-terminal domain-containing protein [Streptomyces sp. PsTaAH-124]
MSAHVFTAHPLDLVIRDLVHEVSGELRRCGLIDLLFFLRHWQGGPHLRLRVRLTEPAAEPEVRAVLTAHTEAFFQVLPASSSMTERQYQLLAAELSAHEPESEPGTLACNDSLAFLPYRPEHAKYGRGTALRAAEESFGVCSELATAAVAARRSTAQRMAYCFALLTGTLDPRTAAPARRPDPAVAAQYRGRRDALLGVARAARAAHAAAPEQAAVAHERADADPVARWLTGCRRAQREAADPARLAGHLTHLACNRLGVRLDQEATLRGLARLAVAELTGSTGPA